MGLTVLKLEVGNPANPDVVETVEFLIDSGALYSLGPRPVMQRLGINPLKAQTFRLANGQTIERQIGGASFKYEDRVGWATVIFGEEEVPIPFRRADCRQGSRLARQQEQSQGRRRAQAVSL